MTAMRSRDRRPPGLRALAVLLLAGVALTLSSCTGSDVEAPPVSSTAAGGVSSEPGAGAPGPSPTSSDAGPATGADGETAGGPATDGPASPGSSGPDPAGVATSVDEALRALAEAQDSITRDQVRAAMEQGFANAGAAAEALEVSVDRTPTGLDVDAIQGSGLISGQCIVGEIREGAVSVTVLPVLATGFCFVGDQR